MAQVTSNLLTPAQQALNSKMFGGVSATTPSVAAPNSGFLKNLGFGGATQPTFSGDYANPTKPQTIAPAAPTLTNPFTQYQPAQQTQPQTTAPASGNTPFLSNSSGTTANSSNPVATSTGVQDGPAAPVVNPGLSVSPTFPGLVGGLAGAGQNAVNTGSSQEQQAFQEAQALQQKLAQSQGNEATTLANMQGNPIPLEFQQGRGNIVQNLYQGQQNALSSQLAGEAALAGQGTALQGQGIGALGSATTATQPQLGGIGTQQYYQPLNADQTGGSSQYGTGPAAASNVASIQSQTSTINDLAASRAAASSIVSNQLTPFLQQNGINPSDFNAVNQFLQNIGAQTSSPQYATFKNMVADLASVYAQILTPPGGSTTDLQTQIAQSLINSTSSGQSILQVIQNLDGQAQSKIAGLQSNVNNLQNGQNVNTSVSGGSSSSSSGSLYDF